MNTELIYGKINLSENDIYTRHKEVLNVLEPEEKHFYDKILFKKSSEIDFAQAIGNMTRWMERYYKEKAWFIMSVTVKDDVTYQNLKVQNDVIWSFLLYAGYLTAKSVDNLKAEYYVPNYEVKQAWKTYYCYINFKGD